MLTLLWNCLLPGKITRRRELLLLLVRRPEGTAGRGRAAASGVSPPSARGLCGHVLTGLLLVFPSKHMYSFLAQPNALAHLDLSNTECPLDMVMFLWRSGGRWGVSRTKGPRPARCENGAPLSPQVCGALLRGCLQYLAVLNLSRAVFSHRYGLLLPPRRLGRVCRPPGVLSVVTTEPQRVTVVRDRGRGLQGPVWTDVRPGKVTFLLLLSRRSLEFSRGSRACVGCGGRVSPLGTACCPYGGLSRCRRGFPVVTLEVDGSLWGAEGTVPPNPCSVVRTSRGPVSARSTLGIPARDPEPGTLAAQSLCAPQ